MPAPRRVSGSSQRDRTGNLAGLSMPIRLRAPLAACAVVIALFACHGAPPPKSAGPLEDRSFVRRSSRGADLLAGTTVHLHFSARTVSVSAGCNQAGGDYSI